MLSRVFLGSIFFANTKNIVPMQVFVKEKTLKNRISYLKTKGKTIGFVPTMGALHDGHMQLIKASKKKCDITVCSIFVNPTQFNNKEDLVKYPRTFERDKKMLKDDEVDIIFHPTADVVYPKGLDLEVNIDLEGLDTIWEGEFRPGHFKGVVQVVKRLLDLVGPDYLFMGQKDFQQFTIISMMLRKLKIPTELIIVPIHREKSGLAMSSRNVRLKKEFKTKSLVLSRMLKYTKDNYRFDEISEIRNYALGKIEEEGLKPEYFAIVNGYNLQEVKSSKEKYIIAIVAAWAGNIRLIDNVIISK